MDREEIRFLEVRLGLVHNHECRSRENKEYRKMLLDGNELPEGVFQYYDNGTPTYRFYEIEKELTDQEIDHLVKLKQLAYLKKISKVASFFFILKIIEIIIIGSIVILRLSAILFFFERILSLIY